jgi:hypothetical protein
MASMVWFGSFEEGPCERDSMWGKRMRIRRKLAKVMALAMISKMKGRNVGLFFKREHEIFISYQGGIVCFQSNVFLSF